jgi:hypothetical protein
MTARNPQRRPETTSCGRPPRASEVSQNAHAIDLLEVRLSAARRLAERAQMAYDEKILNKNDYEKRPAMP